MKKCNWDAFKTLCSNFYQDTVTWLKSKKPLLQDLQKTVKKHYKNEASGSGTGKSRSNGADTNDNKPSTEANGGRTEKSAKKKYKTALAIHKSKNSGN